MKKKKIVGRMRAESLLMAFVVSLFMIPHLAFAIGQTTEPIDIKNALRGKEYQETMIVINTEKTESTISFAGQGDIEKWVEFFNADDNVKLGEIKMTAGETRSINAVFKIPGDIPNGTYKGFLSAIKKPDDSSKTEGTGTTVSQKIDREVTIEVSDQELISFEVSVIPKTYDLQKGENLEIRIIYDNRGNTSITPQAQIKISKDDQSVFNSIYLYPDNVPAVKPGAIFEIPAIQIPTNNFEKGKYSAQMSFLVNGKAIYEKTFTISVDMFGSGNDDSGSVLGVNISNIVKGINNINVIENAVLIIAIIFAMLILIKKLWKRKETASETEQNEEFEL